MKVSNCSLQPDSILSVESYLYVFIPEYIIVQFGGQARPLSLPDIPTIQRMRLPCCLARPHILQHRRFFPSLKKIMLNFWHSSLFAILCGKRRRQFQRQDIHHLDITSKGLVHILPLTHRDHRPLRAHFINRSK